MRVWVLTSLGFSCMVPAGVLFGAKPDIVFETFLLWTSHPLQILSQWCSATTWKT
jgi:hypothetical protein